MNTDFSPGCTVVCVCNPPAWKKQSLVNGKGYPKVDELCVVNDVFMCECGCGEQMLKLNGYGDVGYSSICFVPVKNQFVHIEYNKVLEKEKHLVGAN